MTTTLLFIAFGYFSGSVLFAKVTSKVFHKPAILQDSKDGNPGTANAFQYGGFWCGTITLFGDLLKGAIPVYLYQKSGGNFIDMPALAALVLIAPVLGHAFPAFYRFRGGKGIAVTFGCLLGLLQITFRWLCLQCCLSCFLQSCGSCRIFIARSLHIFSPRSDCSFWIASVVS